MSEFQELGNGLEAWGQAGRNLGNGFRAMQWAIGEWFVKGELVYGEAASQYIGETGLNLHVLQRYAKVAAAYPGPLVHNLSMSHHEEALKLEPAVRHEWLGMAETQQWDSREFRRRIKEHLAGRKEEHPR